MYGGWQGKATENHMGTDESDAPGSAKDLSLTGERTWDIH